MKQKSEIQRRYEELEIRYHRCIARLQSMVGSNTRHVADAQIFERENVAISNLEAAMGALQWVLEAKDAECPTIGKR